MSLEAIGARGELSTRRLRTCFPRQEGSGCISSARGAELGPRRYRGLSLHAFHGLIVNNPPFGSFGVCLSEL